jgi:hypothetical protein
VKNPEAKLIPLLAEPPEWMRLPEPPVGAIGWRVYGAPDFGFTPQPMFEVFIVQPGSDQ